MKPNNNNKRPPKINPNNADVMSNPNTMKREAMNIFKSIAKGDYDLGYVIAMFSKQAFFNAALNLASERYLKADIHRNAMEYAYGKSEDKTVIEVYRDDVNKCLGWKVILDCLYSIYYTGDVTYIYNLHNMLAPYRSNI